MRKRFLTALLLIGLAMPAWGALSDNDFHKLCRKGSADEITAALKDGATLEARNKREETPLMTAAAYNTLEAVKALLAAGADANAAGKSGQTALIAAATNTEAAIAAELLKGRHHRADGCGREQIP